MVVPEQRHALDQRLVGDQHLLDPPVAQLTALLLDRPHDARGLLLVVTGGAKLLDRLALLLAHGLQVLVDPARRRRDRGAPRGREQTIDRRAIVEAGKGLDFGRSGAERRS